MVDVPERLARRFTPIEVVLRSPRARWRNGGRRPSMTGVTLKRVSIDVRSSGDPEARG